jgi:hypothetical protein
VAQLEVARKDLRDLIVAIERTGITKSLNGSSRPKATRCVSFILCPDRRSCDAASTAPSSPPFIAPPLAIAR